MLTKEQTDKMREILNIVDPTIPISDAMGLHVKTLALQTLLLNDIARELGGIERCLERIAAHR